jgi:hypothetical protein
MTMPESTGPWRLDKHIPIAVIFAIGLQTVGIVWWAAGLTNRVGMAEQINARQEIIIEAIKADVQLKADRFVEAQRVLSEQLVEQRGDLRAIRELMQRIEGRLDATPQPRRP